MILAYLVHVKVIDDGVKTRVQIIEQCDNLKRETGTDFSKATLLQEGHAN